jgi:hypothetical protein
LKAGLLLLFATLGSSVFAGLSAAPPDAIVESYCAATRGQDEAVEAASMDIKIDAALPKLKKFGRLRALRHISALGRITYDRLFFEGDGTVKNQVIARYLTAEVEAQKSLAPSLAVTPSNYKFKFKGQTQLEGRDTYIFEVTPRQKRPGLFKGEIWIDAKTSLRVQENGYLVKTPSIFLKKVAFIRKYEIRDGIAVPLQVHSVVDTRLVGQAELTIDFSNFEVDAPSRAGLGRGEGQ